MQERINNLKIRMQKLIDWKNTCVSQQIKFPLDFYSKELIQRDLLIYTGVDGGTITPDIWLEIELRGKTYWISATEN